MKFSLAISALASLVGVNGQHLGRKPHIWIFGESGVEIYTADGSENAKTIPPERACRKTGVPEEPYECSFRDAVSDGHKYVWASINRGGDMIDVFNIDSGSLVGSFGTCGSPRDLDFHPAREEVWVHCSEYSAMEESHLDVFSTVSPAASVTTRVLMHNNTSARSYGIVEVDETLGDIGYATVYGEKYIYKISLSERVVMDQISIDNGNPRLNGTYEMTYSPVNQHLYLRTQVCCTCGFEGADTLECGHYGSINVTISGATYEGQCGGHCTGTSADNIGILEFDTISETVIGNHQFDGTAAVTAPFTSPDGKYVVLPGVNNGKNIQILYPGANGELTTEKQTLELDFITAADEDDSVFNDFAWVQTEDMNLFVLASAIDFKVAIVDMSSSPPSVSYVTLSDMAWPEDADARDRQVEWAEGTDYVWIGGRMELQSYVVDVRNKELVQTIKHAGELYKMLSVHNRAFTYLADSLNIHWDETGVSSSSSALRSNGDGSSNGLSIAALALSCIALVAVLTNFIMSMSKKTQASDETLAGKKSEMPPSVA